jgi:hypothetical protein
MFIIAAFLEHLNNSAGDSPVQSKRSRMFERGCSCVLMLFQVHGILGDEIGNLA